MIRSMNSGIRVLGLAAVLFSVLAPLSVQAQTVEANEYLEVTATKIAEDVKLVPASITIVTADDMESRGVRNLGGALALVSGVSIAPGGDGGPAASVPEMWGLRELDAFLLVVDGVPWGGAFNPALASLDMTGVERIEVVRGAAPVMYGATPFVGVIHVIHFAPGEAKGTGSAGGGSYSSFDAHVVSSLPSSDTVKQSIVATAESQGYKDDRTSFDRFHGLYRGSFDTGVGPIHLDADVSVVNQDPASPHVRQGKTLSPLIPLDANHNPSDAKIEEDRYHIVLGHAADLGESRWNTTLAFTHTNADVVRGFLTDVSEDSPNAAGYSQSQSIDDIYFDTHTELDLGPTARLVAGIDYLYGKAKLENELFSYTVGLDGSGAPDSTTLPIDDEPRVSDTRNFAGAYVQTEWTPASRWRVDAGFRVNYTDEERKNDEGSDSRTVTRGSGVVGVNWLAAESSDASLRLFADYRNTYKPAAFDFGPDAESDILEPETGDSVEAGAKFTLLGGKFAGEASFFQSDLDNLVVSQAVNGLPRLVNSGSERLKGFELEASWLLVNDVRAQLAYANHDARFKDYVQEFDGVDTQLAGKKIEMSPDNLAAFGLVYSPARGFGANVVINYVGERYLNKRNTALADAYTTWSAGVSYHTGRYEVRVDGVNLSDQRDPIAESELGDAQYYRLPARSIRAGVWVKFN